MPISTREVLMLLRARDQASRVITDVGRSFSNLDRDAQTAALHTIGAGQAVAGVGIAIGAVGTAGLAFLGSSIKAASDFRQAAALALTQVDQVGVKVQDLEQLVLRVGKEIPVPFDQLNRSLFDIFSSMNVSVPQAEQLLKQMAKAGVAGQVDVQDAARATIAVMNAWQLPAEDVNKVLDLQFQLVRKGVGTYAEFSGSIGRAIPASVAAGQSFDQLAGILAFLTRNGLSAEMAATSSARAMELFARPQVTNNLQKYGVAVKDLEGNFRPLNEIITELAVNKGWAKMTEPERAKAFEQIFGKGSAQARRFFDIAIPNFEQLNGLVGDMADSSGAMDAAYDIMLKQPQSQVQLLKNQFQAMRIELGQALIPVVTKLAGWITQLFHWFNNLSPTTKKWIAIIGGAASVLAVVTGALLTFGGILMVINGTLALFGGSLVGILAPAAIVIAILAALVVAGILVYKNWDTIKKYAKVVWDFVVDQFDKVKKVAMDVWGWMQAHLLPIWDDIYAGARAALGWIIGAWGDIVNAVQTAVGGIVDAWGAVVNFFETNTVIQDVIGTIQHAWEAFSSAFYELGLGILNVLNLIYTFVSDVFMIYWTSAFLPAWSLIWGTVQAVIQNAWGIIQPILMIFVKVFQTSFDNILLIVSQTLNVVLAVISAVFGVISGVFQAVWGNIVGVLRAAWEAIVGIVNGAIDVIAGIIKAFGDLLQGDWSGLWNDIKQIVSGVWEIIKSVISGAIGIIWQSLQGFFNGLKAFFEGIWNGVLDVFKTAWASIWVAVVQGIGNMIDLVREVPGRIIDALGNVGNLLFEVGKKIIEGLINGFKSMFNSVKDTLGDLGHKIIGWKGPPEKDRKLLVDNGRLIMQGLRRGLEQGGDQVKKYLTDFTADVSPTINGAMSLVTAGAPPVGRNAQGAGSVTTIEVHEGAVQITVDGGSPDVAGQVTDALNQWLENLRQYNG